MLDQFTGSVLNYVTACSIDEHLEKVDNLY